MAGNESIIDLVFRVTDEDVIKVDHFNKKIAEIKTQTPIATQSVDGLSGGLMGLITPTTAAIAAVTGMVIAAKEFIEAAAEAERIESRMAFQIEQVGYSFKDAQPYIDQFVNSILQTTRFSDEMAREGLGRMMQYTSSVEEGMKGVELAMDISTQTGKGYDEMITLVGMAMNGNVERLGRWIPELKNVEDKLGKNATAAEKAEYAMKLLNEKFGGAAQKDLETYAGKVANLKNQWDEMKESAGKAMMPIAQDLLTTIQWHLNFWTGQGPFKSVEKLVIEEKAAYEAWRKVEAQRKTIQGIGEREAVYKKMGSQAEEQYRIEQEYAKKRAQLSKNEYALLEIERNEELEKVRKAQGDEYYVWEYYGLKKVELDKKVADQLNTLWLEYYKKQQATQAQAVDVSEKYGVETTAGLKKEFDALEEDWKQALQGLFTGPELDAIQKSILAKAEQLRGYFGGEGEERGRIDQVEAAFKRTSEHIEDMRKEADIIAGTGYRMQFDDTAVIQAVDELEAVTAWLKYICEEREWVVKVKFVTEGIEQITGQAAGGGTPAEGKTSQSKTGATAIDQALAELVTKNRSRLSKALKR